MKTQIYTHKTVEDALKSVDQGVDFIGLVSGSNRKDEVDLSFSAAREVFAALPHATTKTALIFTSNVGEIVEIIDNVLPTVVQLTGYPEEMPLQRVAELRQARPMVKIMMAVPVGGPETRERAVRGALAYANVVDFFILDTDKGDSSGIGATGAIHDWNISTEIVQRVNVPVILAGGLGPDNVTEAVRKVKPWGVDSLTHTNLVNTKIKDWVKVKDFVDAAKSAL